MTLDATLDAIGDTVSTGRRYFLGDPSLIGFSGHCLEYLLSVASPLEARGHRVQLIGNRGMNAEVARTYSAAGLFTYWCDARPSIGGIDPGSTLGRHHVRRAHEKSVYGDLNELDRLFSITSNDVLVLNTFRHWGLRGIVNWVDRLGSERAPRVVLILHFTAFPTRGVDDGSSRMYEDAFSAISSSPHRERFTLMADSEGLVAEYSAISDLTFLLAPIPHSTRPHRADGDSSKGRRLNLAYVGEARRNKGFHLLPSALNGLLKSPVGHGLHFLIQNFCHDPTDPFFKSAMARMPRTSQISFFQDQLDEDAYQELLTNADAIMIPYLLDNYHVQTSGIYAEAVGMGKPVIVPRGSWMALQVRKYGGGLTFPPEDAQGLLDASLQMVESFEVLSEQAKTAAVSWKQFHNAETLADMIEFAAGDGLQ